MTSTAANSNSNLNFRFIHHILPWVMSLTGGLLFFYESIQMNMFNTLNPYLMETFNTNATTLGTLSAIYFYTNASLIFTAGNLLDRYSPRKLILISMCLCTLGTFFFAISPNLILAGFSRFLVGIGGAFCFVSSVKLASRWFPPHKMALIIGVIVTLYMFGGMVAQTPLTLLTQMYGWRNAMLLNALLGSILTLIMYTVIQDRPAHEQKNEVIEKKAIQSIGLKQSVLNVIKNKQNWLGAFYTCLMNAPVYLIGAFIGSLYLQQVHHLSPTESASASSMLYFGSLFGSPLMGWFSDKLKSRKKPMLLGAITSTLIILTLLFSSHQLNYISIATLFGLLGLSTSSQVIGYPIVGESNSKLFTGTAVSIVSMVTVGGGALLLPFAGWLLDKSHHSVMASNHVIHYSAQAYTTTLFILPIGFIIALLLTCLMKETHCKQKQ